MDKLPEWAEKLFTNENIVNAVDACMWHDCSVCPLCGMYDTYACRTMLVEQMRLRLDVEKNKNNLKKGLDTETFLWYNGHGTLKLVSLR